MTEGQNITREKYGKAVRIPPAKAHRHPQGTHLDIPRQNAFDPTTEKYVESHLSFSPAHTLAAHRPLGSINRARLAAYTALSTIRQTENQRPATEPARIDQVPA